MRSGRNCALCPLLGSAKSYARSQRSSTHARLRIARARFAPHRHRADVRGGGVLRHARHDRQIPQSLHEHAPGGVGALHRRVRVPVHRVESMDTARSHAHHPPGAAARALGAAARIDHVQFRRTALPAARRGDRARVLHAVLRGGAVWADAGRMGALAALDRHRGGLRRRAGGAPPGAGHVPAGGAALALRRDLLCALFHHHPHPRPVRFQRDHAVLFQHRRGRRAAPDGAVRVDHAERPARHRAHGGVGSDGQLRPLSVDRGPSPRAGRRSLALHLYRDRAGDRLGLPGVRRRAQPLHPHRRGHRGRLRPLSPASGDSHEEKGVAARVRAASCIGLRGGANFRCDRLPAPSCTDPFEVAFMAKQAVRATDGSRPGINDDIGEEKRLTIYRLQVEIRESEQRAFDLFLQNLVKGTSHLSLGQEAVAAGFAAAMKPGDLSFCTYRGHAHTLARGVPIEKVLGELMQRDNGLMRGKGGSMHLTSAEHGVMGSYAIIGAHLPIACGAALRAQYKGDGDVTVCFFGDGTTNIGAFHEALNFAAVWKLPVIFVCENNLYMEYTPIGEVTAVEHPAAGRAAAYGLEPILVDGQDADAVFRAARTAYDKARAGGGPSLIECRTYRYSGHSRADPAKYRPEGELEKWKERDPIKLYRERLKQFGVAEQVIAAIDADVRRRVDEATEKCKAAPPPPLKLLTADVYADGGFAWRN